MLLEALGRNWRLAALRGWHKTAQTAAGAAL
jgi:hypothetical protein